MSKFPWYRRLFVRLFGRRRVVSLPRLRRGPRRVTTRTIESNGWFYSVLIYD